MTLAITHSTVVVTADDGTSEVGTNEWNAAHTLTGVVSPSQGGTGVANNDSSTLTISGSFGTTFTVSNTTTLTLPTTGTVAVTANKLSAFAATTSAELAGVISDETGSGLLVFATSPTLTTPVLGTPTSGTLTNCTGPVKRFRAFYFYPQDNEPPATNYATLDTRNAHPVLDFDDTTGESAIFTGVLPATYNGGGITVSVAYSATSATTGTVGFTAAIERIGDSQLDVDADSFASAATITATTVPGTSGHVTALSVNISDGANMDSLAAGEQFRLKVTRDVANDSAVGDAEVHWVSVKEQ